MSTSPPAVSGWGFTLPDWGGYNVMRKDAQSDWQKSIDWQERMSNTSWQRATADMQAAGINPMLAVHQGGASTPQAGQIKPVTPPAAQSNQQLQTAAQTELIQATADKERATAENLRGIEREHKGASIEQMQQQISESMERIMDIRASVGERTASAARQHQQVENLRAELPRIKADTARIVEQMKNFAANTSLTGTQEKEAQQRIKQNLPEIERLQRDLQLAISRIQQPGHELDADVRQSFIGILGKYIQAVVPAIPLIGFWRGSTKTKGPETSGIIHKGTSGNPTVHRR